MLGLCTFNPTVKLWGHREVTDAIRHFLLYVINYEERSLHRLYLKISAEALGRSTEASLLIQAS